MSEVDYNAQAPPRDDASSARVMAWALEVGAGVHTGARFVIADNDIVAIGAGADCEVILSDPGVAEHHGLLIRQGGACWLRAVDAPLVVNGQQLAPGDPRPLAPDVYVAVGEAGFSLVECQASARAEPAVPPTRHELLTHVVATDKRVQIAVAVLLVVAVAWFFTGSSTPVEAGNGLAEQQQTAQAAAADSEESGRTGSAIAEDVAEVLRLSGIDGRATFIGQGRVKVKGYLGDVETLKQVIHSRAMRDIEGLEQVVAVNFNAPSKPEPEPEEVVAVVDGDMPYLVTASGGRYYIGARLPGGGRLTEIRGEQIVIENSAGNRLVDGVGAVLGNKAKAGG